MFAGTGTALITPFDRHGEIDEEALRRLVDFQESNGVNVLVPCGSTGESATLTKDEHVRVISIVRDQAKKAKVLAGAGSNCTKEAVELSRHAQDLGADGILSISPYYVKPTQEGIYLHYKAISEAVDIPIVIYNIPGRTNSNITADTLLRLAEMDNIVGVKEASGSMVQIQDILSRRPAGFEVLSGDDSLALALICLGADGVISVASNCCPGMTSDMIHRARAGDFVNAKALYGQLLPLFNGLFVETNPIPIKYVMARMGFGSEVPRLPLTPLSEKGKAQLDPILAALGIN